MNLKKWMVCTLAAALVAGSLAGCGAKTDKAEAYADQSLYDSGVTYETSTEMAAGTMALSANRATAKSAQTLPENRKWIITMNLSAETDDLIENAKKKLVSKNADMVVANDVTKEGAGFNVDTNIATIITRDGKVFDYDIMPKNRLAEIILDRMLEL